MARGARASTRCHISFITADFIYESYNRHLTCILLKRTDNVFIRSVNISCVYRIKVLNPTGFYFFLKRASKYLFSRNYFSNRETELDGILFLILIFFFFSFWTTKSDLHNSAFQSKFQTRWHIENISCKLEVQCLGIIPYPLLLKIVVSIPGTKMPILNNQKR